MIDNFLKIAGSGSGYGYGSGYGSGYGEGYGSGSGSGSGSGYGEGYGSGSGEGSGSSYGYGYGYGSGSGYGEGSGYGSGEGYGVGSGYGSGVGSGYGLKTFNEKKVYYIDGIPTIIEVFKNNIAKGFIVNSDLTLKPCYVAKVGNYFAHGDSVKEAVEDASNKHFSDLNVDEKIEQFKQKFKDYSKKVSALELFDWHGKLTGSCKSGRGSFCHNNAINVNSDSFTIFEFIELTKNSYGGDIIKKL